MEKTYLHSVAGRGRCEHVEKTYFAEVLSKQAKLREDKEPFMAQVLNMSEDTKRTLKASRTRPTHPTSPHPASPPALCADADAVGSPTCPRARAFVTRVCL